MAEEKKEREQTDTSLEMRVAALEDKLAGFNLNEDELETYRKVMKVTNVMRARGALRRLSRSGTGFRAAESGCISGCISPCDCSDCGCVEGCVEVRADSGCISGCISPCDCSDCGCVEGCVEVRADSGCISGCISPCDCASCGCIEGCIEAPMIKARPRSGRTFRRFGRLGR
jgi:hypothetical protein